ncbi:ty3-gypsy retrotransposon protein, partial [Tanacetum coccineum]
VTLAKRYYGSYEVMERIGKVAYRLPLPATSKIHSVFHVSILKAFLGNGSKVVAGLPEEFRDGQPVKQPLAACAVREVLQNEEHVRQIMVQWVGGSPEEATWEWLSMFQNAYPRYNLEDKVVFEERENVMPATHKWDRATRIRKAPGWQKDFKIG